MAAEQFKRADVGFQGGQVLSVRVAHEAYDGLRNALGDTRTGEGEGAHRWHELRTADSDIAIDLSQVVYVRVETEEQRVGF
jgi:hypothetical protein